LVDKAVGNRENTVFQAASYTLPFYQGRPRADVGIGPYRKSVRFPTVGGDALIAPQGTLTERSQETKEFDSRKIYRLWKC